MQNRFSSLVYILKSIQCIVYLCAGTRNQLLHISLYSKKWNISDISYPVWNLGKKEMHTYQCAVIYGRSLHRTNEVPSLQYFI
jgi:hypothetical protein